LKRSTPRPSPTGIATEPRHTIGTAPMGAFLFWNTGRFGHVGLADGNGGWYATGVKGRIDHTSSGHYSAATSNGSRAAVADHQAEVSKLLSTPPLRCPQASTRVPTRLQVISDHLEPRLFRSCGSPLTGKEEPPGA
jgi:hypothetical protein